jgi:alkanesulfonate monooxygenase SsuD/methylene tetrahydromethanopterin reductase-like flavin-dependent oxidoreductase (luciferase family)
LSNHTQHLILSAAIFGGGYYPSTRQSFGLEHYRHVVQTAESGLLDFVFLHDERGFSETNPAARVDALSVLSRLAPETKHVGLVVSVPTTHSEPFNVSRELATLDFVSGGRAGWNATTIPSQTEAQNFGRKQPLAEGERREVAEEFVEVSRKLWDSWEDDAVITDFERGFYLDPEKLHHVNHVGRHFKIRGPQLTYRPPQGQVVVVQVEQDDKGVPLSPEVADVLVLRDVSLEVSKKRYQQFHNEAQTLGRELRVLQTVLPVLADTKAEAEQLARELEKNEWENTAPAQTQAQTKVNRFVGTPSQVADTLEHWFKEGAADGFHFLPSVLPEGLETITRGLVPELQQRGLFRSSYTTKTLREHLRLSRPLSRYAVQVQSSSTVSLSN